MRSSLAQSSARGHAAVFAALLTGLDTAVLVAAVLVEQVLATTTAVVAVLVALGGHRGQRIDMRNSTPRMNKITQNHTQQQEPLV